MSNKIFLGDHCLNTGSKEIKENFVTIEGEQFYQIENYTEMPPFFMTVTSSANHWMFISSTGGLTAGRVNSESSFFPYYTDDRITENNNNTGPQTVILVERAGQTFIWKPFTKEGRDVYDVKSLISKNVHGNIIKFEEVNSTLGISFSYLWTNSKEYGLVRKSEVKNLNSEKVKIDIVDGLMNILPAGVETQVQNEFSCLLNGYKRSELSDNGLGLFTLSATLTDLAEPSEALKANTVWQTGLEVKNYLLGEKQLEAFCRGESLTTETDEKGDRGCYFVESLFNLGSSESKEWLMVADVEKDLTDVNALRELLKDEDLKEKVLNDVKAGTAEMVEILNQNDGLQISEIGMNQVHHEANVMFNIMRGGFFHNAYTIDSKDFIEFVISANINVYNSNKDLLDTLKGELQYNEILKAVLDRKDSGLERLWYEYLPLTFSRRHGDPSRPWNKFSIETTKEDGSAKLDYQGNWRDIFQNWEALCFSYPEYIKHVIGKFLNASTKDGYNPYRISKSGIDWECPEPGNPWANIGYWSDHQIIYLLKLLEMYKEHKPQNLKDELNSKNYTFANVPYQIKSYQDILKDPYETIVFNNEKNDRVKAFADKIGSEGKMLHTKDDKIVLSSLTEKLLIHLLTKLGNFIPEGGIWMNTQRPEWNDANNALVGKGISVITLAYIRRYISFMIDLYEDSEVTFFTAGEDTSQWLKGVSTVFTDYEAVLADKLTEKERFEIVKKLGKVSDKFRAHYYNEDVISEGTISRKSILKFLNSALNCVDNTLYKNRRADNLYHSYNTLEIKDDEMIIHNLYEMLEGQVAILTSGLLKPEEAAATFRALRESAMYREDQNSYMLYPNRDLAGFTQKNIIPADVVNGNKILKDLAEKGNRDLITKDVKGEYHFNGSFHNSKQVKSTLEKLGIHDENNDVAAIFETTFDHQSFTGRSGTFFAYEGLGSIYWHMVSKLLLTAQENLFTAVDSGADEDVVTQLKAHYYDIRNGIGYNKSAKVYGAFPFDPYSHTPYEKGAKQPGMTGQVKEEVITRVAEMGIRIKDGEMVFDSTLIDDREFLASPKTWNIRNNSGKLLGLTVPAGAFAGTHCQTPYIVQKSDKKEVTIHFDSGSVRSFEGDKLPADYSSMIFKRESNISWIEVSVN